VDDEDFEVVSKYRWSYYRGLRFGQKHDNIIKAYCQRERRYVYLSHIVFGGPQHVTYIIRFRDGNNCNWQRSNLQVTANVKSRAEIQLDKFIEVPDCPFGPAKIESAESGRSEECTLCDDYWNGPYYHCLDRARRTFWRGWRRRGEKNDLGDVPEDTK
jgi:hypothetical protein